MNMHGQFQRDPRQQSVPNLGPYLCWTRMQAEAGQGLERIIARKEVERRAGRGLFFWGVGNAPATATRALARCGIDVPVIFSVMKSRPKAIDAAPDAVVAWTNYIDEAGAERPLPEHVLVTSRRDSASGPKRVHFALMCFSEKPLELVGGIGFDHQAYRNAGSTGGPVGASQVTALLQPVRDHEQCSYEINMRATLTGSYWVKLTTPVPVPSRLAHSLPEVSCSPEHWMSLVNEIRARPLEADQTWDLLRPALA